MVSGQWLRVPAVIHLKHSQLWRLEYFSNNTPTASNSEIGLSVHSKHLVYYANNESNFVIVELNATCVDTHITARLGCSPNVMRWKRALIDHVMYSIFSF